VRRLTILTTLIALSCSGTHQKERLFASLYRETFIPRDWVTIEFVDSTSYIILSGTDSVKRMEKGIWSIENRLTGTYLIMNSSEMRLEALSDSVVTFSKGEFTPRFVKVRK
jgi:hypothetical protein